MTEKEKRLLVYKKCNGHCGYCGKEIKYKDMQVDHVEPKCRRHISALFVEGVMIDKTDDILNLLPVCRRCNHYKRSLTLEAFRDRMKTVNERIAQTYIGKVAVDYGILKFEPFNGLFYFETLHSIPKQG